MTRKKIVFVIVEGPSDAEALEAVISKLFDANKVHVHIVHGDITTRLGVTGSNILSKVYDEIKSFAQNNSFKKKDFQEVIHIVDMDGAYIDDRYIVEDEQSRNPFYSLNGIRTCNVNGIKNRNRQKQENLNKLCVSRYVWKNIPYRVFYMSCNLEHVLYNEMNCTDKEKERYAHNFAMKYKDRQEEFLNFISKSDFSYIEGYKESWKYIKQDLHSLERCTNFGLCFLDSICDTK